MRAFINSADKMAVLLSMVCTIHCLAIPALLLLLPTMSGLLAFNDEAFHYWLLFAVIPISLFAVIAGYIHHRKANITFIAGIGMALLIVAVLLGHDLLGEVGEVGLTVLGSVIIAFAHLRNLHLRKVQETGLAE